MIGYWKGKKLSKATKNKMRNAKLGIKRKPFSSHTKLRMRNSKLGKLPNNFGKPRSLKAKMKQSESMRGDKSPLWRGGISKINKSERQLAMNTIEYRLWRESVFERDKYTCVWCGKYGVRLNADHILPWGSYPALRFAIDNGRTLCVECHRKTDTYGSKSYTQK